MPIDYVLSGSDISAIATALTPPARIRTRSITIYFGDADATGTETNAPFMFCEGMGCESINGTPISISGATAANPCEITTSAAHGLTTGNRVTISGITGNMGTDVLNGNEYVITKTAADKFTVDADTSGKTYTSDGTATPFTHNSIGMDNFADTAGWTASSTITTTVTLAGYVDSYLQPLAAIAATALGAEGLKYREP